MENVCTVWDHPGLYRTSYRTVLVRIRTVELSELLELTADEFPYSGTPGTQQYGVLHSSSTVPYVRFQSSRNVRGTLFGSFCHIHSTQKKKVFVTYIRRKKKKPRSQASRNYIITRLLRYTVASRKKRYVSWSFWSYFFFCLATIISAPFYVCTRREFSPLPYRSYSESTSTAAVQSNPGNLQYLARHRTAALERLLLYRTLLYLVR